MEPVLRVVMYHYVRDLPRTRFPRIHALLTDDFRTQLAALRAGHEMATPESALAFLSERYKPDRDLCLLTFDDGFKECHTTILPILAEAKVPGVFFLITSTIEDGRVMSVHKNHFLMAALEFPQYRGAFLEQLGRLAPRADLSVDAAQAARTYRWDTPEVAAFKFLLNFRLDVGLKDRVLDELFQTYLGDEGAFAAELYVSWDEARQMQRAGMVMGGHTHRHQSLAAMTPAEQAADLRTCRRLLDQRLASQPLWPFSYPYGKNHTFTDETVSLLKELGFACAFATEVGDNSPGQDAYRIRRVDPKDVR